MDVTYCWLCGERPCSPEEASSSSEVLRFSCESVSHLVAKFGLKDGEDGEYFQDSCVCEACMLLVTKIDGCSFELDNCVNLLRQRIVKGALIIFLCPKRFNGTPLPRLLKQGHFLGKLMN